MSSTAKATLAGKRILVVEDTALVAHELEFLLKRLECGIVGPATDLEDAMNMVQEGAIDGAILDVNLHGTESYPLAEHLESHGIPFVFTTGYGTESMPKVYHNHPRLEKPFGLDDLTRVVSQMFAK